MAKRAAGALLDYGVRSEHISIVLPEGYDHLNYQDSPEEEKLEKGAEKGITTTTAADAAGGAAKGAGIGLAAGALAALASVFIPGFGLVLGGGALAMAIGGAAGTTAAGAVAGGVTGFLKDQGVPEDTITTYNTVIQNGGAMITVSPTDESIDDDTIRSVLTKYSGQITAHAMTPASVL
jgi:hypothetical protein